MGKGALRPFFKGHSLKKEKEHEKKGSGQNAFAFCHTPFRCRRPSINQGR